MRWLVETHHPAHIHFFKYAVREWRERGDDVLVIGRDRDVMKRLFEAYSWIPSELSSTAGKNNRLPVSEMLRRQIRVARAIGRFKPDAVLSVMGSYTQSSALMGVPSLIFTDSEHQALNHRIAHPFATRIFTPQCFWKELGPKQRRYEGYHELAFLHPERFTPSSDVLSMMGDVEPGSYVICRVSAWNTLHDIGAQGFSNVFDELMAAVSSRVPVFVMPEGGALPPRWESKRLRIPPERFHDALAYARLVISEGASTASEAACLGVPTVYLNPARLGYLQDQEARYGLVSNFSEPTDALDRALEWLDHPEPRAKLERARGRLVSEHEDVTDVIVREADRLVRGL